MKCDHCRNTATENGAICKDCKWYLFFKKKPTNLIGKGERELQNERLNCASKYMLKRVRCLEDDIMYVVDHVSISKQALLKRNCYNVTDGIKRLIAQTVSAKCEGLREEFANVISECLLDIQEKEKPTPKECASSPLIDNWFQEELTTNSHSHNEENSTTSVTTDKQTAESLPKDVINSASKKGRKRPNARISATEKGRGRSTTTFVATYHSELIGDENSIKIRIKKSNLVPTQVNPQEKESRKRKKDKQRSDIDYETRSKRNKMKAVTLQNENNAEEPTEQCVEIEGTL